MSQHVSMLQLAGAAVLALVTVVWVIALSRLLRHGRSGTSVWSAGHLPHALPGQRSGGPHRESVELTSAERDAFAGLVRQLSDGR
ncbi:hypothetical protein [Streptomyces sp. NPDC005423]|uniref:hypothetical protein n=1 Tax=Streptomyces sp. NPDC005423 TaxID=3155343 RepID=UPI0033B98752